jgi:tRNA-Thr(GGU) m(6)t(6)A37 methyltransferase TsaA
MNLRPIGFVRNEVNETPERRDWWQELVSEIVIDEGLTEGLDGLENCSHIIVLYWMHRLKLDTIRLKIHPRGDKNVPIRGLFATRTPSRPNPIGKMTVRLLRCEGNVLTVRGLDALDGTPVIDIKPYAPGYDSADYGRESHG